MSFQKEIPSIPVDRKVFNWLWVERNCITVPGNDDDGAELNNGQWPSPLHSSETSHMWKEALRRD